MSLRAVLSVVFVGVVAVAGCGGDDDEGGNAATTTTPTTVASWSSAADILVVGTEQALPPVVGFADALRRENARIGATDRLDHDPDDAGSQMTLSEGPCTEVGFVSYFYVADVGATETPSVGILAPAVQVYVCADEASRAEQELSLLALHGGTDGLACAIDPIGSDSIRTQVCPNRTLDTDRLIGWDTIGVGSVDLALVAVTGDLAPDTDPAAGAESMEALVEYAIGHLAERLG